MLIRWTLLLLVGGCASLQLVEADLSDFILLPAFVQKMWKRKRKRKKLRVTLSL